MYQKRKILNLAVKKQFQLWLLARVLGTVAVCSVVATGILYFYARQEVATSFFDAHIRYRRVSDLLLPVVLAGSIVSLLSGLVLSLFLPQKIAGPIFRIEQDLKAVENGDLSFVVRTRQTDILTDLVASINDANEAVRFKVQGVKDSHHEIAGLVPDDGDEKLKQAVEKQRQQLDSLTT